MPSLLNVRTQHLIGWYCHGHIVQKVIESSFSVLLSQYLTLLYIFMDSKHVLQSIINQDQSFHRLFPWMVCWIYLHFKLKLGLSSELFHKSLRPFKRIHLLNLCFVFRGLSVFLRCPSYKMLVKWNNLSLL